MATHSTLSLVTECRKTISLRNPNLIFADAPEDSGGDYEDGNYDSWGSSNHKDQNAALSDHVRKEILELGFPDDGYDYLSHLREIKNKGGGSTYYDIPKASFTQFPRDVKAYDSSRVEVHKINDVSIEKSIIYSVAAKTVGVRLPNVLDADVAAMLDDSDSSKFESDVEDLEEDFVVRANLLEGASDDDIDAKLNTAGESMAGHTQSDSSKAHTSCRGRPSHLKSSCHALRIGKSLRGHTSLHSIDSTKQLKLTPLLIGAT